MDPGADRLIGEGSFKIDRPRALEKLMRFQLPDARMYPLPWVQAAVASGAKRLFLSVAPAGFELSFDGAEWDPKDLEDPYRHLFEEDPDGSRARHRGLGIGLLSALRTKPDHVSVLFAHRGAECALLVRSLTVEELATRPGRPLADQQDRCGAPVTMSIFVGRQSDFARELEHLREHCRHCPIPIELGHGRVFKPLYPPEPAEPPALLRRFRSESAEGRLALARETLGASRVQFVTHGVTVESEHMLLPGLQGAGVVFDDALRTSISQAGVLRDERRASALRALEDASLELLKDALAQAGELMPRAGTLLLKNTLRRYWLPWVGRSMSERLSSALSPAGLPARDREEATLVARASLICAALREACLARRIDMLKHKTGAPELLWDAPVLLERTGRPSSLRALDLQRRWLGHVPYTHDPEPGAAPALSSAWTLREPDQEFLEAFFPGEARPLAGALKDAPGAVRPAIEDLNILTKLEVEAGPVRGELGLSLSPHTRATRIRWLSNGRPVGRSTWPFNGLRLEAAVDHASLSAVPQRGSTDGAAAECLAALFAAAPRLYRRLATNYDPGDESPRGCVIREHLLDLLASGWTASAGGHPEHPWLSELKLFRTAEGRLVSLDEIKALAHDRRPPALCASPHPEKLRHLFTGYPRHAVDLFEGSELARVADGTPAPESAAEEPPPSARAAPAPLAPAPGPALPNLTPPVSLPAAAPAAPPDDLAAEPAVRLNRWLAGLRARGAFPFSDDAFAEVRLSSGRGKRLLTREPDRSWTLELEHPLLRLIESRGGLAENLPYLVSVFVTGLNRLSPELTDEADARFAMSLAEFLLDDER